MASNSSRDLAPSKNSQEEYFGGFSKSRSSFAIDPTLSHEGKCQSQNVHIDNHHDYVLSFLATSCMNQSACSYENT